MTIQNTVYPAEQGMTFYQSFPAIPNSAFIIPHLSGGSLTECLLDICDDILYVLNTY